jgi:hypothetical protein
MAIRSCLAAVTLTAALAGAAGAQQSPPAGEEPTQQGYQEPPLQGYEPPVQQETSPPGNRTPPEAAPPPVPTAAARLGAVGQFVFTDDLHVAATRSSTSFMNVNTMRETSVLLQPAMEVFLASNFSIGGQVRIGFTSNNLADTTTIGLLPRVGYDISIGPTASIWPRASLAYLHNSTSSSAGGDTVSWYTVSFIAFVPVLFQPAPHFFIGGGPYLSADLISKYQSTPGNKTTALGLVSTVGGYFGGI